MKTYDKNAGGSYVDFSDSGQQSQSILLSDVFEDIANYVETNEKIPVILKMDIEAFECRAILGSKSVFDNHKFFIPYIIMEWNFR